MIVAAVLVLSLLLLLAPAESGTLVVLTKLVVERIFAVCALLLLIGLFHGGLSLAVALLLGEALVALAAATADGVSFC